MPSIAGQYEANGYTVGPGMPWGVMTENDWYGAEYLSTSENYDLADGATQGDAYLRARAFILELHLNGATNGEDVRDAKRDLRSYWQTGTYLPLYRMAEDGSTVEYVTGKCLTISFDPQPRPQYGNATATVTWEIPDPTIHEVDP